MKTIPGGVVAPRRFRCAAVGCGVKTTPDALDLGLILSDLPAAAAAVFTTNRVQAAPVLVSRKRLRGRKTRGIVVNAGNANACTGDRGFRDALRMTELAGRSLGVAPAEILVASTGIIGQPLPMRKIEAGIRAAANELGRSARHALAIARAIMTTDTVPKCVAMETRIAGKPVRIGAIAKGAGMVAPNMATLLVFLTTDCAISTPMLRKALRETVKRTFNRVTVDGESSTNDMVAILANGAAGNPIISCAGMAYETFLCGLLKVAERLARDIVRDGEGATRLIEVEVTGGRSQQEAEKVARSIANSPLVKAAIHGSDPNWGRIICAAGHSGASVEPNRMRLWINGVLLFRNGMPYQVRMRRLAACMKPKEVRVRLDLGRGKRTARLWTCDLSEEYVSINAEYHT